LSISFRGDPANVNVAAGRTRYAGEGVAVTASNLYQIGSNTKAFTAVTILQLEAAGALNIAQTLGRWLPEYPSWKQVTIRRLLDMTSGIPDYIDAPSFLKAFVSRPNRLWTVAQLIAFVDPVYGHALPPTRGWSYSNTNYLLAQLIIEHATGHSYADEITRRFLTGNLRLRETYYQADTYPKSVTSRMVSGYFFNSSPGLALWRPLLGRDVKDDSLSWAQGAGGMVSTLEDLTHWVRALYEGDMLAPAQRYELMSIVSQKTGMPVATTTRQNPRGFGLAVGQETSPALGTFWFYEGETPGYRTLYAWLPKSDAVIAIGLNSSPSEAEDHIAKLLDSVYSVLHRRGRL
jgi:D-alanyl-D-alanine carboxypeptidase